MSIPDATMNLGASEDGDSDPADGENGMHFPQSQSGLNQTYNSFADFSKHFEQWKAETFQTFVKASGSDKVPKEHKHAAIEYRKIRFECVHHGTYVPQGKGERIFTHSRLSGCPAYVALSGSKRTGLLTLQSNLGHNHRLSEEDWKHYPGNRKLSSPEKREVNKMQTSHASNKAIVAQMRVSTGKIVLPKDIRNVKTKTDIEKRGGLTEEQLLNKVLSDLQNKDLEAFVDVVVTNGRICVVTIVTSAMKRNFEENPTVIFLDGTYKVEIALKCANLLSITCSYSDQRGELLLVCYGCSRPSWKRSSCSTGVSWNRKRREHCLIL